MRPICDDHSENLAERLTGIPLEDRWAAQRACAEHLRSSGIPADLLARIEAFAFYREMVAEVARTEVARAAITSLGCEYGLVVLAERFAHLAADGTRLHVTIDEGPPLTVRTVTSASRAT